MVDGLAARLWTMGKYRFQAKTTTGGVEQPEATGEEWRGETSKGT